MSHDAVAGCTVGRQYQIHRVLRQGLENLDAITEQDLVEGDRSHKEIIPLQISFRSVNGVVLQALP